MHHKAFHLLNQIFLCKRKISFSHALSIEIASLGNETYS